MHSSGPLSLFVRHTQRSVYFKKKISFLLFILSLSVLEHFNNVNFHHKRILYGIHLRVYKDVLLAIIHLSKDLICLTYHRNYPVWDLLKDLIFKRFKDDLKYLPAFINIICFLCGTKYSPCVNIIFEDDVIISPFIIIFPN